MGISHPRVYTGGYASQVCHYGGYASQVCHYGGYLSPRCIPRWVSLTQVYTTVGMPPWVCTTVGMPPWVCTTVGISHPLVHRWVSLIPWYTGGYEAKRGVYNGGYEAHSLGYSPMVGRV